MAKSFHDLVAFQRALDLMVEVYRVTAGFPRSELYGLVSQLRRASLGVASDIAEGQGRLSYGEWRQFLGQARGSLFEVEAELFAARRLGFIEETEFNLLRQHTRRTGSALQGLINWVCKKEEEAGGRARANLRRPATRQPDDPVTR